MLHNKPKHTLDLWLSSALCKGIIIKSIGQIILIASSLYLFLLPQFMSLLHFSRQNREEDYAAAAAKGKMATFEITAPQILQIIIVFLPSFTSSYSSLISALYISPGWYTVSPGSIPRPVSISPAWMKPRAHLTRDPCTISSPVGDGRSGYLFSIPFVRALVL